LKKIAEYLQVPIENFFEGAASYDIKNGDDSPFSVLHNSTLITQNEKLIESHNKICESILSVINNQNEVLKELTRVIKQNL
jgi:hypothetical protein